MECYVYGKGRNCMSEEEKDRISREEEFGKKSFIASVILFCKKHRDKRITVKVPTLAVLIVLCALLISSLAIGINVVTTVKSRTVNFGLKDIGELSTQVGYFTNVQVINGSRQLWGTDIPLTQSKYVFSYDGIIKAGLDFESIEVNVNDISHTIRVRLPEMKILSYEIDTDSLEIYDETNSIFTPLSINDVNLSLIDMKEESRGKAISNGILDNARSNAETLIKGFLAASYDLQAYSITFE